MKLTVKGINLLPKQYIQEQINKKRRYIAGCVLAVECVIFVLAIVIPPKMQIKDQQKQLDALQVQLQDPKYEGVNKAINDLDVARKSLEAWNQKYSTLKSASFISTRLLDSLTARIPSGVVLGNIAVAPGTNPGAGTITLTGEATDSNAFLAYVTYLEGAYGNNQVGFSSSLATSQGTEKQEYLNYTITINIAGTPVVTADQAAATTEGNLNSETPAPTSEGGDF